MRAFARWLTAAFSSGVVLVVAACATPQDGSGPLGPGALGDAWPGERTFVATSVTENGAPKALVGGSRITVDFHADGRIGAHAGCNSMGGHGRVEAGKLVVDDLAMTEMGCSGGLMEQEKWVADLLTSRPALRLSGDELTLAGETITLVLRDREIVDPDRPLVGTAWTVTTVYAGDSASNSIHPVPAVLTIEPSGRFTATTGCVGGELRGTAAISDASLTITVSEQQPCLGGSNEVDEAVRATLTGTLTYEIEADQLRLLRPDGHGLGLAERPADGVEVDCGTVTVGPTGGVPAGTLACFVEAVAAGRSAHLSIVRSTKEGDPVPVSYRADGTDSIHVFRDHRQDRFGIGRLEYQVCHQPRVEGEELVFATCTEAVPL
jgi:heat shock protein HslJ